MSVKTGYPDTKAVLFAFTFLDENFNIKVYSAQYAGHGYI